MSDITISTDRKEPTDEEIISRMKVVEEQEPEVKPEEIVNEEPGWDMRKLQGMDDLKTWDEVQANGFINGKMFEEIEPDSLVEPLKWDEAQTGIRASWTPEEKKKLEVRRQAKLKMLGFA